MERRGLVAREDCTTDRRGAFVVLTAAGREAIEKAAPEHGGTVRQLVFDGLSKEQFTTLESFVSRVLSRLDCGGGGSPARRADTEDVLIVSAQVPTALACVDHMKSVIPGLRWTTAHVLVSEGRLDTPHTALTGDTGREFRISTRPAPEGPADSCNTCRCGWRG